MTNHLAWAAPRIKMLENTLKSAREQLLRAAEICDSWAVESQSGGWSTHQVQPNIARAHILRIEANWIERVLNGDV